MEEKKFPKSHSSLWSFFGFGSNSQSFLGKFHFAKTARFSRGLNGKPGFTLVELLVVVIMLGALAAFIIVALNPLAQIQKSQDAQREHDLKQLNSAMDTYYNDINCYPVLGKIPNSGSIWTGDNSQVYTSKIPGDPAVFTGWRNYAYITDTDLTDTCPQWNVLFAKVSDSHTSASTLCPLVNMKDSDGNSCLPANFNTASSLYNYCILSGNVDCKIIEKLNASDPNSIQALGVTAGGGNQQPSQPPTQPPQQPGVCPENGGSHPCNCSDAPYQNVSNGNGTYACNSHQQGTPIQQGATGVCCTRGSGQTFTCDISYPCTP